MPSEDINYWQDEYSHTRSTRTALGEQTATMSGTYIHEGLEYKEWRMVRNLVDSVLPAPFQSRFRQLSSRRNMAESMNNNTEAPPLPRRPPVPQRAHSANEADTELIPQQALPNKRAVNAAFNGGKWFSSVISSSAMGSESPPTKASGVDWKSGSQGLPRTVLGSKTAD